MDLDLKIQKPLEDIEDYPRVKRLRQVKMDEYFDWGGTSVRPTMKRIKKPSFQTIRDRNYMATLSSIHQPQPSQQSSNDQTLEVQPAADGEDLISLFDDDVLDLILSKLPLKDLFNTSLLSKRWSKLWLLRKTLQFDSLNILGSEDQLLQAEYLRVMPAVSTTERPVIYFYKEATNIFVARVEKFLENFQVQKIESFQLNFTLQRQHERVINKWIIWAMERKVENIGLFIIGKPYGRSTTPLYSYRFDSGILLQFYDSTLKYLHLENCLVFHSKGWNFRPFKNLNSLSLEHVYVEEMFLQKLLANCKLKDLSLIFCMFYSSAPEIITSSLNYLKVVDSYVYLENEKIQKDVELMVVYSPKLISLEYHGTVLPTLNVKSPLLKSVKLSIVLKVDFCAFQLCASFPELEIMSLNVYPVIMSLPYLSITQRFSSLKQLKLMLYLPKYTFAEEEYNLLWISKILLASPLLNELSVMIIHPFLFENQKATITEDIGDFSHAELKNVELGGCTGNDFELEFIFNILKFSPKLQKMVVSPYWREDDSMVWNADFEKFKTMREKLQGEEVIGREKLVLK